MGKKEQDRILSSMYSVLFTNLLIYGINNVGRERERKKKKSIRRQRTRAMSRERKKEDEQRFS